METFFIVGTGRCGTTVTAQILNSHSKICVPHELQILFEYSGNGARLYEIFSSGLNLEFSASDYIELIKTRCPHKFKLYFDYISFFKKLHYPITSLKVLVNNLYEEIALSKGKTIFSEQTPWYGQRIDILNALFPDAKYIHVVRDGRDVAISFARTPWWHKDVYMNLRRWEQEANNIRQTAADLLQPGRILQIRYEDLVTNPKVIVKKICDHLNIDFEDTMLNPDFHIDYGQYSRYMKSGKIFSHSFNEWKKNKSSAIFNGSCLAWRKNNNFDFSNLEDTVSDTLDFFGYER